jgi:chromatin remodeling complex protein RSC6
MAKKGSGLTKPVELTDVGYDLMKKSKAARQAVTKKLWAYIKANDLQNPKNRKNILLDDSLKYWLGTKKREITMFEMTKLASKSIFVVD